MLPYLRLAANDTGVIMTTCDLTAKGITATTTLICLSSAMVMEVAMKWLVPPELCGVRTSRPLCTSATPNPATVRAPMITSTTRISTTHTTRWMKNSFSATPLQDTLLCPLLLERYGGRNTRPVSMIATRVTAEILALMRTAKTGISNLRTAYKTTSSSYVTTMVGDLLYLVRLGQCGTKNIRSVSMSANPPV